MTTLFVNGRLHTPYHIFLRAGGRYSDQDLLTRFGLGNYRPASSAPDLGRQVLLVDAGEWTLIADDWYYTLWHMSSTRPAIAELAKECDVYACAVGDCDQSFDFVYYRDGRLVRKYVAEDPDFRGPKLVENFGPPLPGEVAAFRHRDQQDLVLEIAAALGVPLITSEDRFRIYVP